MHNEAVSSEYQTFKKKSEFIVYCVTTKMEHLSCHEIHGKYAAKVAMIPPDKMVTFRDLLSFNCEVYMVSDKSKSKIMTNFLMSPNFQCRKKYKNRRFVVAF